MTRSLDSSSIKPKVSIILASGSESRKLMLEEAGIVFDVIISSTDEDLIKNKISSLPYSEQVVHLAKAKSEPVSKQNPDSNVIGGDQMCALDNTLLHQPGSSLFVEPQKYQSHIYLAKLLSYDPSQHRMLYLRVYGGHSYFLYFLMKFLMILNWALQFCLGSREHGRI